MNEVKYSIDKQGARPPEINVEVPDKPIDPCAVEKTKKAVKAAESHETIRKQREEKLDLWMENIKEFIRNIDVKSL